ncbi:MULTISPECIES: SAM-dependent methyltransferase [Candidatus Nitrosocaldus]|jgi:cobalt-precorrin-7 (C5)-methyltransferase|uniref:Putative cobalt-precorrin-7 C(5)-methyltransferase n=1 Tax=Candidatus Nitrosocaldus cavascurensis TaxID=2058097 RepID=A0A2K5ANJ1_9ARCH|nr:MULTISPECIES: SAM-dependent methyltransferase [Candidatus Nitrosocaldus]GBC74322.1 Siroheme synthase [archaeon HR05]SPC33204.1 putative cobalt-precorrin-7 C(5)-methyltransferase [Candidatus Nitrosocaldus cavascurensis]
MGKVYLVGVGPGGEWYITEIAKRLIERADVVVGYKHALNVIKNIVDKGYDEMEKSKGRSERVKGKKDIRMITLKTQDEVYAQLLDYLKGKDREEGEKGGREKVCCILFTGDPDFSESEIVDKLVSLFESNGIEVEIIPGISSVQVAAARSKVAIDRSSLITFHVTGSIDREKDALLNTLRAKRTVILLPRPWDFMPQHIGRFLRDEGIDVDAFNVDIYENLTLSNEKVTHCKLADIPDRDYSDLCVMVIKPS